MGIESGQKIRNLQAALNEIALKSKLRQAVNELSDQLPSSNNSGNTGRWSRIIEQNGTSLWCRETNDEDSRTHEKWYLYKKFGKTFQVSLTRQYFSDWGDNITTIDTLTNPISGKNIIYNRLTISRHRENGNLSTSVEELESKNDQVTLENGLKLVTGKPQ